MSAGEWQRVCETAALLEGGDGVRFDWQGPPDQSGERAGAVRSYPAFVVRVGGAPRAFLNRCAHVPVELDWMEGKFLAEGGLEIVCATHGASYDATDGRCTGGPCRGRGGLFALAAEERDGAIWVRSGDR